MKKMLSYAGLLVLAGIIFGAIVTGLVWMQHLYDLSVSYYLFTAAFWLGMVATVLFGIWLRRYFQQLSKVWVLFSVLTALFGSYLFPKFLTPRCSEIPTVKAGCTTTCVDVCTHWVEEGTRYKDKDGNWTTCTHVNPWDIGCCIDYAPSCTTECTWYPPTVTGHTTCATFGNDGWCVENGQLHMSGTDPEGLTITISGTMVGQSFSCTPGYSCVRTLFEGDGNAVFHSYNGHLSSGNFSVAYKYDATPPTLTPSVTGTAGSNGWYTSVVSVATGATDSASGVANSQIRLLSGTWQNSVDFTTEGTHSFEMSALDVAGNEATQQAQVMVDTVPPVQEIGITSGTLGTDGYYLSDVTITATSGDATSGVDTVMYRDNRGAWQTGTSVTLTTDGSHTVEFLTTDVAGLTDSDSMTVLVDQTNPVITINPTGTTGLNGWYVSTVDVDINATDATSGVALLEYSVDGGAWVTWVSTITLTDGYHVVDAYAEDHASNYAMENMIINVDTLPPVPDVQAIADAGINDWYRSDVNWQATATDATSTVASIEVNADASGWNLRDTAFFTTEGPHTVDFRFTDMAGNDIVTNQAFSIDKTAPTIKIDNPIEGNMVSRIVIVRGTAADTLSGLTEVAVSPDGGYTWHIISWQADGSWTYDWDTTSGPNGVFALIARATDEAGNVTTDQVNVIVDNAPPTVSITESWDIWDTARGSVHSNVIPVGSIHLTVECGDQPDRTYDYNANTNTFDFKWDRRCGDGNLAPSGTYTVVLEACDIYNNCDEARGKVDIPFVAFIAPPTSTPMPTLEKTEPEQIWYSTPTPVPSYTATPTEQIQPILPATGGDDSGDGNVPTGTDQPLLPLAAAALGTSVLLAASSKREEREAQAAARLDDMQKTSTEDQAASQAAREDCVADKTIATVNVETPYLEVASLAALAGVVKETFSGVWEDAVRISPADAPITIVTHNWVNGVDPVAYYEENAERLAAKAKFWQDVWIASQKKYYEEQRLKAIEEAKTAAAKEAANDARRYAAETARWQGLADEYYAKEAANAAAEAAQKIAALDAKLAKVEAQTANSNVITTTSTAKVSAAKTTSPDSGGLFGWISDTVKAVVDTVTTAVTTVKDTVVEAVTHPVTTIKNVAATVKTAVTSTVKSVANTVKTAASTVKSAVTSFVTNPVATIENVASAVQSTAHNVVTSVKSTVANTVNTVVNKVNATKTNVVNTVKAASITTGIIAGAVAEEVEDGFKKGVAEYLNDQIDDLGTLHDVVGIPTENASHFLSDSINNGLDSFNSGLNKFLDGVKSTPEFIDENLTQPFLNFCNTIPDFVKSNVADPLTKMENEIIEGLPDDLKTYNQLRGFLPGMDLIDTEPIEYVIKPNAMFELGVFADADIKLIGTEDNTVKDNTFFATLPELFKIEFTNNKRYGYSYTIYTFDKVGLPEKPIEGIDMVSMNMLSYSLERPNGGFFSGDIKILIGKQIECTSDLDQKSIKHGVSIKINKYMRLTIVPIAIATAALVLLTTENPDATTRTFETILQTFGLAY